MIRDKIDTQKRKTCEDEGDVTIMFIKIANMERIDQAYSNSPKELFNQLEKAMKIFSQIGERFGL
jgi:hypothetical protein